MKNTVVFLPGWTGTRRSYQKVIQSTPPDYNLLIISYKELIPYGKIQHFNNNLLHFLKNQGLTKIILVGHSLGGGLAANFAVEYPEKIEKLVLIDSVGIPYKENCLLTLVRTFKSFFSQEYRSLKSLLINLVEFFSDVYLYTYLGFYAYKVNLSDRLTNLKVPTIILWGEKDYLITLDQGIAIHNLIPNSKLIIFKKLGHDWISYFPKNFWDNL